MFWLRIALLGVVLTAIAGATFKVTSFLHEKDKLLVQREAEIEALNARVAGLIADKQRLEQSNASLEQEANRRRDELIQAQVEQKRLSLVDQASNQRLNALQKELDSKERADKLQRISHSRHAELLLKTVNNSAKCQIDNFFRTGGDCRGGTWVADSERSQPKSQALSATTPTAGSKPAPMALAAPIGKAASEADEDGGGHDKQ
jgi:hypothetical protein